MYDWIPLLGALLGLIAGVALGDAWQESLKREQGVQVALAALLGRLTLVIGGGASGWAIGKAIERTLTLREQVRRGATGVYPQNAVEQLLPREAYELDRSIWCRECLVSGIWFGTVMMVFGLLTDTRSSVPAMMLRYGVFYGVFGGVFSSVAWTVWFRHFLRGLVDRLYAGDPNIVPSVPELSRFDYRLLCNRIVGRSFGVGGMLYIGRAEWLFVPHRMNLPRHREPLRIAPLDSLSLALVPGVPRGFVASLLGVRLPPLLEVRWPTGEARFVVPAPERAKERLEQLFG